MRLLNDLFYLQLVKSDYTFNLSACSIEYHYISVWISYCQDLFIKQ
jgi:hypothetical protein